MSLFVLGINHKTATVDLREKVAFSQVQLQLALEQIKVRSLAQSAVIISTCNRTEVYYEQDSPEPALISQWLRSFHQIEDPHFLSHLYQYQDEAAVQHLMKVACGLDSLVLGEPQILGQVKQAYHASVDASFISNALEKLFQKSFAVAKKVRTQTNIGEHGVSIAFVACSLAKQIFESLEKSTVLLVGAGEMIELVAKHLHEQKCQNIIVANRTPEHAKPLADAFNASVIGLNEISDHIAKADIVISSTAATLPIISKGMIEQALKARRHQPMLLIDIAVPRDIEAQVGELSDIYLYTIDDLYSIVEHNIAQRKIAAKEAEAIIYMQSASFMAWICSLNAVESIKQYRTQAESEKNALIAKSLQALENGVSPEKVLVELSNKLMNKLIHAPTQAMQIAARNNDEKTLQLLRQSFDLSD